MTCSPPLSAGTLAYRLTSPPGFQPKFTTLAEEVMALNFKLPRAQLRFWRAEAKICSLVAVDLGAWGQSILEEGIPVSKVVLKAIEENPRLCPARPSIWL